MTGMAEICAALVGRWVAIYPARRGEEVVCIAGLLGDGSDVVLFDTTDGRRTCYTAATLANVSEVPQAAVGALERRRARALSERRAEVWQ